MENKKLTLGSLFDGSGGFPLGGILAGIEPRWASEIEPFPIRITTKRLPQVRHLGDITTINGGKIEPVDIITGGFPCQSVSVAGKRHGLRHIDHGDSETTRTGLFYEMIRIVKEMRIATDGKYPRFLVAENVTGLLNCSGGRDFRNVLTEIVRVKVPEAPEVPMPQKDGWPYADVLMGDGWSVAYRVLDAQFFGVAQRRRRIYLVADFAGGCAGKILFESEGVSGYSTSRFRAWQDAARAASSRAGAAGGNMTGEICLNDMGGSRMDVTKERTNTLRASSQHPPLVFSNHSQDSRYTGPMEKSQTLTSMLGTGGNSAPLVVDSPAIVSTVDVRLTSEGTKNARHNIYETDVARCLDTGGNCCAGNQGGVAVVEKSYAHQGSMIGREDKNGPQGSGVNEEVSFSLTGSDRHAVYAVTAGGYTQVEREKSPTLMSRDYKDPISVNQPVYSVRRLTPPECALLMGFPPDWCAYLGTENPTDEEMAFWRDVFETHRKTTGAKKAKTDNKIRKWLANPHTDGAEYRMWGNGCVTSCVWFVLAGIAYFAAKK